MSTTKAKVVGDKLYCISCGRFENLKDFYDNRNEYHKKYHKGKMFYCKSCSRIIGKEMRSKCEHFQLFTISLCNFFDVPYRSDAMIKFREKESSAKKDAEDFHYLYNYCYILEKEFQTPHAYWNNLSTNNNFLHIDLLKIASPTTNGDMGLFDELKYDWGELELLEDYSEVQTSFNKYSNGEDLPQFIEKSFKRLCLAELDYTKARAKKVGEIELKKIEEKIADYGKRLKLDEFTSTYNKSAGEQCLEKWISIEENTRPVEVFDKLFADDMCNIRKDYDHIMRSLKNLVSGSRDFPELTEDK